MTIAGWLIFVLLSLVIIAGAFLLYICFEESTKKSTAALISIIISIALILALFLGMRWYFNNTASGQRALVDERSNLNNGIERVINVYTADGNKIATYEGKIDIDMNDGGYVKFDFEGKRYIYYNCFIETIANIN